MGKEVKIDEELIFLLQPEQITINKDLPRRRKDLGKIEKMMKSIETFGQLQPIVINRNNELIYGGRRLAACTLLNIKVRACYKDTIDPLLMRELELEENLQRKDFTPAEECLAVEELVKMKQEKYGKPVQGKTGGFTLEDAAETIGKTKGNVIESLQIAEMIKSFPSLKEAKTKSEIKKAYKGLQKVGENIAALASYEKSVKKEKRFFIRNADARDDMKEIKDKSVDLLFTDPPYGINIDKVAMSTGGATGGDLTTTGIKYDDSTANALGLYEKLAFESYRFCKDTAHALVFCAPSTFLPAMKAFNKAGWICSERPVIWIKGNSGQNNQPSYWFSAAYEILLFARKPLSRLVIEGKVDWLQCDIIPSGQKIHQAEKPIPLLKELISRVALPGQKLYDPFMGSGSIIEAACEMKLIPSGCELAVESYAAAAGRMNKWKEEN